MRRLPQSLVSVACLAVFTLPGVSQKNARKPVTSAPAATPAPAATTGMTNDDVIALAGAGMSDDVILAKIHAAPSTSFDTSIAGLKALKAGGVSSSVIRVMVDPSAPAAAPAVAAAPAAPNPDDPAAAHSPGVYMLATGKDGHQHLTMLDHITSKNTKSSGAFLSGMTYGITKAHVKASIDGAHASVQTPDTAPTFYAYIPQDNQTFGGATITTRDLSLIRFDPKDHTREINTATISPWGASTGNDEKAKQGFAAEQIKTGVYKMTLDKPLPPGQYAFQQANYGAFFDFGIIPAQ